MLLRPLPFTRLLNTFPGLFIIGAGIGIRMDDNLNLFSGADLLLAAACGVLGAIAAARGYRLGVHLDAGTVTIFGQLRDRHIPRASVLKVTDDSHIIWSENGRTRRSLITAFMHVGSVLPHVHRHNTRCIARLRRALGSRRQ